MAGVAPFFVVAVNEVIGMLRSVVLVVSVLGSGLACSNPSAPSSLTVTEPMEVTVESPE